MMYYSVVTKFCPWASWDEINPLGCFFLEVRPRSDFYDTKDKYFLNHFDKLIISSK